jgi:hypothetical protein
MRNLLAIIALLLASNVAEAQLVNLLQCTVQSTEDTEPPGSNCTYGGLKRVCQPLAGGATTTYRCFPGNTGPTGATGATGPAGATGATGPSGFQMAVYDQANTKLPATFNVGPDTYHWDGSALWTIDSWNGVATTTETLGAIQYTSSTCSDASGFVPARGDNIVRTCNKQGIAKRCRAGAEVTLSSCYQWSGATCASTSCPSGPFVQAILYTSDPDFSAYNAPFIARP